MKLLPRLYNPERGKIYIDGYDISKVDLSSIRRQVGIVPQDSLLFEGTVAENISLNDPQASTESVIEAAKIACAHDFIMELPNGYATRIVERGSNLSGGQRQRIAIARTILANPHLLIMDEPLAPLILIQRGSYVLIFRNGPKEKRFSSLHIGFQQLKTAILLL